jgi:hypothetical protein
MPNMKKIAPKVPTVSRAPSKGVKKPLPKIVGAKPGEKKLMPKTTTKPKERMTKQDAAMKKILEKRYGKIYG